eukprot:11215580-Lingulodinium_polyedra.AAC.1
MRYVRGRANEIDAWPTARRVGVGIVRAQQLYPYFQGRAREFLFARIDAGQHVQNDLMQAVQRWAERLAGGAATPGQPRGAGRRGLEALERAE